MSIDKTDHEGRINPVEKTNTNITDELRASFEALMSGEFNNFALFSCFANGEPTSAIVAIAEIERDGEQLYQIKPLFVAITPGMKLSDHDGIPPIDEGARSDGTAEVSSKATIGSVKAQIHQ